MRSVVSAAAVAAAAVLAASACGGRDALGLGGAAPLVPANAVGFVALDTSLTSGQWQAAEALLQRFSSYDRILARLRDAKPAFGDELDLAFLPGRQVVGLTQPADPARLSARLATLDPKLVTRAVGGWTAFSRSRGALAAVGSAPSTLAADNAYRDAIAQLPGDALVRAYANGAEAAQLLGSLPGQRQVTSRFRRLRVRPSGTATIAAEQYQWGSADIVAVSGGLKLEAHARAAPPPPLLERSTLVQVPLRPYAARLPDEIPAGALFVADVQVATGQFETAPPSTLPTPLQRLAAANPELPNELDSILGGETALYVRLSLPLPEVTLVTQPPDTRAALAALDVLVPTLGLGSVKLVHALIGGELVVSTSRQGIADFRAGGAKLSSDPAFTQAARAAGMPAETTGFVYADLQAALPVVQSLAPLAGVTVPSALQPLRSLTAYASRTGDLASFTVFLAVR